MTILTSNDAVKLLKYYNTIRYLKPVQMQYQVLYKAKALLGKVFGRKPCYAMYRQGRCLRFAAPWIEKPESYCGNGEFEFLGLRYKFNGTWDDRSNGDLWRYNFNYMDFLLQPSMGAEEGCEWIEKFIASMPLNSIANDPYPISLRGINWIKFVSRHRDSLSAEQMKRIDTALYSQYLILAGRVEKHLLANHYLENGFSLLFGALYFNDEKLLRLAGKIIRSQLEEQILPDGAHFELSPMYHCVILERLLDCISIAKGNGCKELLDFMFGKAKKMLGWLTAVVMSDGNIPLLNDSALGIAPLPAELAEYADTLGVNSLKNPLLECGYRRFEREGYDVFADVAAIGPSYNPGHSHADTFTFVMNVAGKPFIVDTGTSTYTAGTRRSYERSTIAHNTVSVAGRDSSRVWGSFRCAERAKVVIDDETCNYVKASHNGYSSMGVTVSRSFAAGEKEFTVIDEIHGKDAEGIASFHLAPGVEVISATDAEAVTSLGTLRFSGASAVVAETVEVSSSYNSLQSAVRLSVSFRKRLSTVIVPKTI
ncbi:MAG: alginate lyase family protein [Bacteroidaceae bacterium]|nr:alginate lyase family protein [Bacteroidaceae bacterium]